MKTRKQQAKPCERKGKDNHLFSFSCELRDVCFGLKDDHRDFCLKLEESLIDDGLVRYETKEITGLHVLFNGIEKTISTNSEDLFHDEFLYEDLNGTIDSHFNSLNSREYEKEKPIQTSNLDYQTGVSALNNDLGYNRAKSNEIFGLKPTNLYDSLFTSLYKRGIFNPKYQEIANESESDRIKRETRDDDLYNVATILLFDIKNPKILKKIWSRYTPHRFEKNKQKVLGIFNKNLPEWAKRLNRYWNNITDAQREAIDCEYFFEGFEKPTQKESAQKLGISKGSYEDRLEGAYKKLLKLYPEYERVKRRKKKPETKDELLPMPLYELISGFAVEVPHPEKKNKKVSRQLKSKIFKEAENTASDFMESVSNKSLFIDKELELEEIEEELLIQEFKQQAFEENIVQ